MIGVLLCVAVIAQEPSAPARSRRSVEEIFPERGPARQAQPGFVLGEAQQRPAVLQERSPAGAAVLGGLVGFGTGHYYAGAPRTGAVMSVVDVALLLGFAAAQFSFTERVVANDQRTGRSLADGDRSMGERERRLYATTWALGASMVASRAFQGLAAWRVAGRTNRLLAGVAFVPLEDGGVFNFSLPLP